MNNLSYKNISELNSKGVYKIYLYSDENKPFPIERVCKTDCKGLLYIGCTKKQNFKLRLSNFISSMSYERTNNHTGGNKISKINILKRVINNGILKFEIIDSNNPLESEKEEIKKYIHEFGEKPPLNG
jgi:hypothetical protein